MNTKVVFSLVLGVVILSAFFVYASTTESYINIEKGWNLIYGFVPSSLEGQTLDFSHIKAIYAYVPMENGYVRIYPNPENEKIDKYGDSYFEKQVMWVYSDLSQRTEYWLEEPLPIEERPLVKGWNFVAITSDMFEVKNGQNVFSWNGVKGDCRIEKIYSWNSETRDWTSVSAELESFDFNDYLGSGMIVKVTDDCSLGYSVGSTAPPPLPTPQYICTDTDNGSVIDIKGHLEDESHSAIYDDYCLDSDSVEDAMQNGGSVVSEGKILVEYMCGMSSYGYNYFDCSERGFSKCSNGACVN